MSETIRLGGNIELVNVNDIDGASLIILKKMIGNYARKFSERGVDSLSVIFDPSCVKVDCIRQDEMISSDASSNNLFFAVDTAFKDLDTRL